MIREDMRQFLEKSRKIISEVMDTNINEKKLKEAVEDPEIMNALKIMVQTAYDDFSEEKILETLKYAIDDVDTIGRYKFTPGEADTLLREYIKAITEEV